MATVGIVGLGLLGGAVASRLRAAGHAVVGHDVAPARVAALEAMGGKAADSPAAVARAADAVCTVLPSLAVVEDVILGAAGLVTALRPEQPVIQMSTISPALTERLAAALGAKGLAFLDCPISGTSGMVERGDGIIFGRAGLDLPLALEVLRSGAAGSRMLDVRGPMMVRDAFPAQMKLDLFMKDLHLIQDAAGGLGAGVPLTDVAERLYADAMARGHHGEDLSVVIRSLADLRSPPPAQTR